MIIHAIKMSININLLPYELISIILHKLPYTDKHRCREVCSFWSKLVDRRILTFGDLIGKDIVGFSDTPDDPIFMNNFYQKKSKSWIDATIKEDPDGCYSESKPCLILYIRDTKYMGMDDTFLHPRLVALINDHNPKRGYDHYANWRIREIPEYWICDLSDNFKYIGEKINNIIFNGADRNFGIELLSYSNIDADEVPGKCELFDTHKSNEVTRSNYRDGYEWLIQVCLNTKYIKLGVNWKYSRYLETIWELFP